MLYSVLKKSVLVEHSVLPQLDEKEQRRKKITNLSVIGKTCPGTARHYLDPTICEATARSIVWKIDLGSALSFFMDPGRIPFIKGWDQSADSMF